MKLKELHITGFKSFADKTEVKFHEGITAIVGPNGCGKSNIGDAIQWVLGEQSVKFLRGGKMPDVIFAGTDKRKPLGFAEVSILFDDVEGALNVPYKELLITRRLYLNGDSQFYINKQEVRLKDIQRLLFDSGIGKRNFSTFQQREIDAIIQQAPKERRAVFEEAAEINRFLHNRKETLRRLEEVELNCSRIGDVKEEVSKRVLLLKEQAEEAERFCKAKERLEFLEVGALKIRHDTYSKKYAELKGKEGSEKEKYADAEKLRGLLQKECERLKIASEASEREYALARERLIALKGERELADHKLSEASKSLEELLKLIDSKNREKESLESEKDLLGKECARAKTKVEALLKEREHLLKEKEEADAAFKELEKEVSHLRAKQGALQKSRIEAIRKEADLKAELSRQELRLEGNQEKRDQLIERKKELTAILKQKEAELKEKLSSFKGLQEEAVYAKASWKGVEAENAKAHTLLEQSRKEIAELEKEHSRILAKKQALSQLQKEGEGLSAGGKKLLKLSHQKEHLLFGLLTPLYELISPDVCEQEKLQLVMKRYQDTLVVSKRTDLELVLQEAERENIKEFSLLCLEEIGPERDPTAHFFSPLKQAATYAEAFALADSEETWCEAGCLVDRRKVRFFGGVENSSAFSREKEIQSLAEEAAAIEAKISFAMEKAVELDEEKSRLHSLLKEADFKHRQAEMASAEASFLFKKAEQDKERVVLEVLQTEQEADSLQRQIESILVRKDEVEKLLEEARAFVGEIDLQFAAFEEHTSTHAEGHLKLKSALESAEKAFQAKEEEVREARHALSMLSYRLEEAGKALAKLDAEIQRAKEKKEQIEKAKDMALQGSQGLHSLKEAEESAKSAEELYKSAKKTLSDREEKLKECEELFRQSEAKIHQTGIQLAHVETGLSSLERELAERFSLTFSDAERLELPLETAEKEIKKLKSILEGSSQVNLAAIEECKEQLEREEFLSRELSDLIHSKEELLNLIRGIEGDCRKAFLDTFAKIRLHFRKNFEVLFQGGEADIELVEGADPLEAGVEISAKPPGKQMRSLSLLSGGEKCLTAMALLFAIFEVKSSPFCLLDEIDAPLDDSNVERFVAMVRHYTDRSQFIIVTHNKRTMAIADRLYGVSMQEKGVSKLLSFEFSKDREPSVALTS